jgi:hypothetical protein
LSCIKLVSRETSFLPSQTKTATLWACRFLMMISAMHIIYLHGFNSGPQSLKAQETARWLAATRTGRQLHCPQLSSHPAQAIAQAEALLLSLPADTALIGSSLGATTPPPWQKNMAARPR